MGPQRAGGTVGARALAVNLAGQLVAEGRSILPAEAMRVAGRRVEQDPLAWTSAVETALRERTGGLPAGREIVGIGGRIATRFGLKANTGAGYGASCDLIRRFLPAMIKAEGKEVLAGNLAGVVLRRDGPQVVVDRLTSRAGPAASRLRPGDVVVGVGSMSIRSPENFYSALGSFPAGATVQCWARREGKDVLIPLWLESKSIERGSS